MPPQKRSQTLLGHGIDQHPAVPRIARAARGLPALRVELLERCGQRC